jgi:anti-sigma B factor antagonist
MSKILVARSADLGFFKAFYQQLLKDDVSRFVVDLEACTYLDSTFLGTLLGLGLKLREAGRGLLHILNANPRNLELLRNLGLDRLINIEGICGESAGGRMAGSANGNGSERLGGVREEHFQEIPCPVPTRAEAAPTILEAHENLMEFDPRNVPKFKDVVEFLREDLGQAMAKH